MEWSEQFTAEQAPTEEQISEFISSFLWQELFEDLKKTYNITPKIMYSGCSMGQDYWKGWNVKFKKSGKSFCTVYPKQGYFVAMLSFSVKELDEVDTWIKCCEPYTQKKYQRAKSSKLGKSISFDVTSKKILLDIQKLVAFKSSLVKKK